MLDRHSALRGLLACTLLLGLSRAHASVVMDDFFISSAYAHEWASTGVLRWTSGEVVEGYSNFSWLLMLTAGALADVDVLCLAKIASLLCGCALVAGVSIAAPRDWRGDLLAVACATWAPVAYWASSGMETLLFAALLAGGWACALRPEAGARSVATLLLAGAAITHPEGHAHLVLGLIAAIVRKPRWERTDAVTVATIALLGLYHIVRIHHFGHVWPAPFLAKVSGVHVHALFHPQLGRELVSALGVIGSAALIGKPTRRNIAWIAIPLAIQCVLLIRASGDWMGWARFVLPGLFASLAVVITDDPRPLPPPKWLGGLVAAAILACAVIETPMQFDPIALRRLFDDAHGVRATFPGDVAWIVENVPTGDIVFTRDVGLVGNIPGVRVRDQAGLVDRRIAEFRASGAAYDPETGALEYGPGPDQIAFLRVIQPIDATPPKIDAYMAARFTSQTNYIDGDARITWFRTHERRPTQAEIDARWKALGHRYPCVSWLRWRSLLVEVDEGAPLAGPEAGDAHTEAMPESLSFVRSTAGMAWEPRGFALYSNGTLTSRPLRDHDDAILRLEVHDPGPEGASVTLSLGACTTELRIVTRTDLPLSSICEVHAGDRLTVQFTNDAWTPETDRNVYATFVDGTARGL